MGEYGKIILIMVKIELIFAKVLNNALKNFNYINFYDLTQ